MNWFGPTLAQVHRWRDDRLHLTCDVRPRIEVRLIQSLGCGAVGLKVVNKGKRTAKISGVRVALDGKGFLEQFQKGFATDFGHQPPSVPEGDGERLDVACLPVEQPGHKHGWAVERDDYAEFLFPSAFPAAVTFATANPDQISVRAVLFDGRVIDLGNGDKFQTALQPLVDAATEHQWDCLATVQVSVQVTSTSFPDVGSVVGSTNNKPVAMPDYSPTDQDFSAGDEQVESKEKRNK